MQRNPSTRAAATAMPDADASLWTALHAGVAQVAAEVRRRIDHVAYRAQQTAIRVPLATTRAVASALVGGESPDPAAVVALPERYDLTVELLFAGTADVMRRQVIPPVSRVVGDGARSDVRLLDVACGTGRTLAQIARAHPRLRLYGLDLSPYYLQVARRVLADVADVSLVADNAERLPFRSGYFDVVTSVFLFHELPRPARRAVLAEMHRVLRPGGLLVIVDSAQLGESGELAFFLGRFAAEFHEPFYRDYVRDDLAAAAADAGLRVESVEPHFVSKVVVARKLAGARGPTSMHRGGAARRRG